MFQTFDKSIIDVSCCQQGLVQQQTAEVDNAETAAVVAIDDREAAAKKLAAAQRNLEDAKGKQQHSLQVTATPAALPEVTKTVAVFRHECLILRYLPFLDKVVYRKLHCG